jgi:hypothetical protein
MANVNVPQNNRRARLRRRRREIDRLTARMEASAVSGQSSAAEGKALKRKIHELRKSLENAR